MERHQSGADSPRSPNVASLDLRGEQASAATHGPSEGAGRVVAAETEGRKEENLRVFRIDDADASRSFCSNYIKTTKYTILSFLPLAILYQYKKLANWYFLLQSVLSCLPISPWAPYTMVAPTVFVLMLSVLREGAEDYWRYKSDKQTNRQQATRVLKDGSVERITSGEVRVGDVIYVGDDEDIPADVLLLGGGIQRDSEQQEDQSEPASPSTPQDGTSHLGPADHQININDQTACFLQTSSLDGEKNLKKKVTPPGFKGISLEHLNFAGAPELRGKFPKIEGRIVCDLPNNDLHQFKGLLDMKSSSGKTKTYSLGPNQLLLKGSKLMNTARGILGIVVYTGIDTKVMQNQHNGRHKQSKLEKETNKIVIRLLILLALVSMLLSWQSYRWDSTEGDGQYYLYDQTDPEAKPSQNRSAQFFLNFLTGLLINSTFVPISLIVTLELVKMVQGKFISWDFEMVRIDFDQSDLEAKPVQESEANDAPKPRREPTSFQKCKVLTCSINEELGQVRYVFSDKTGTLTMNAMEFRLCKIGNHIYGDRQAQAYIGPKQMEDAVGEKRLGSAGFPPGASEPIQRSAVAVDSESEKSCMSQRSSVRSIVNRKQGASYNYHNLQLEQILFGNEINEFGQQAQLNCNMGIHSKGGKASLIFDNQKSLISEFLQCIATTHECVPEEKKAKTGDGSEVPVIGYQGPSPDEVALLEFAQNHGFEYAKGTDDCLQVTKKHKIYNNMSNAQSFSSLQAPAQAQGQAEMPQWITDEVLDFKLLKRIEFSSDRKRMSVVVQDLRDGLYKLYCKGADNVIKERLRPGYFRAGKLNRKADDSQDFMEFKKLQTEPLTEDLKMMAETDEFLQQCSTDGYRTLLVAMRVLDADEANEFVNECALAESDIEKKEEKLDKVYDKWERELSLLGATVLEDRLQENVQNTISSLHQADIKVWVLTGDKLETAESIGFSSKLLTLGMDIVRCRNEEDVVAAFNRESASKNEAEVLSGQKKALIIESEALKVILRQDDLKIQRYFLKITKTFETVICCRVSPRQKAEVVKLVKEDDPEAVTLAIGDGANDVSMILEADLGIGLFGNEGRRAADSSDFAICEFQHLWPLLFKQGRWLYARISFLVIYSLYKSFMYTILQVLFARANCYSFQTVFPDFFLTMYNTWFTAWPIPVFACIDLDLFPGTGKREGKDPLLELVGYDPPRLREFIPSLYFQGQRNVLFNQYTFLWWMIRGLYEALIVFLVTVEALGESHITGVDGQTGDLRTMGVTMFTCVMFVITNKLLLKSKKMDAVVPLCHLILSSLGNYYVYLYLTDSMAWPKHAHTFDQLHTSPVHWLIVFFVASTCFLIDLALDSVSYTMLTSAFDLIRSETLEKGGECSEEFVSEFRKLSQYQSDLGKLKDSVREQQVDYRRAIKAALPPEELREVLRANQAVERNLGGVQGLFSSVQARLSAFTSGSRVTSTGGQERSRYHGMDGTPSRRDSALTATPSRMELMRSRNHTSKARLAERAGDSGARGTTTSGGHRSLVVAQNNKVLDVESRMIQEFEMDNNNSGTPLHLRGRTEMTIKTDKKSGLSTQKNLVSPLPQHSLQEASPKQIQRTIFKELSQSPNTGVKASRVRQANLTSIQKSPLNVELGSSHIKSAVLQTGNSSQPNPLQVHRLTRDKKQPSEGFINLQRHDSRQASEQNELPRIDCFDKSYDYSHHGSARKSRQRNRSIVSSKLNSTKQEPIAEEVPIGLDHTTPQKAAPKIGIYSRNSEAKYMLELPPEPQNEKKSELSAPDSIRSMRLDSKDDEALKLENI